MHDKPMCDLCGWVSPAGNSKCANCGTPLSEES